MADPTDPPDALDRLRLARAEGVGAQTYRRLLDRFGSARAALAALPRMAGGRFKLPPPGTVEAEAEAVRRRGGRFLFQGEADYPALLALLTDPPPVLAMLGDPAALAPRAVALVGARNASAAGRRLAEELAEGLAAAGVVVVSGLARGIDAAAHQGALRRGRTLACVAGGLDVPYPPEHAALQDRIIADGGAVLAEAPLGTAPLARHFPKRNRIVAGMALGVVVVEAAPKSGSLITARLALEAGRELFALPGSPLDPRCRGTNDLIRQGAHITETAQDVLDHLPDAPHAGPLFSTPMTFPIGLQEVEEFAESPFADPGESGQVLGMLGVDPVPVDEVMRRCHLSASVVQAILLDLELAGRVEMLPGNRVATIAPA